MKAIRPIFDELDDLDGRTEIDSVDILVCMFSLQNIHIASMNLSDEEKHHLQDKISDEYLQPEVKENTLTINGKAYFPDPETIPFDSSYSHFSDSLSVLFEIRRWLCESGYKSKITVNKFFRYNAYALGITDDLIAEENAIASPAKYIIYVENNAFRELNLLLPIHWANILLDWQPYIDGGKIEFGDITIYNYNME